MEKEQVLQALKAARETSPKRNFKQSVDFIVNLKGIDLKKPEQKVDFYVHFNNFSGRKTKICAFIGAELADQAKSSCDTSILIDEFGRYDKKATKKLAEAHDFFIAQANIMPKVAQAFGRVLGPRGKMPNPKAGCVVPPNANLKALADRLRATRRIITKNDRFIMSSVGSEEMNDSDLADNVLAIYNHLAGSLPNEKENIKSMIVKLTMGKPIAIGASAEAKESKKGKKKGGE